MSEHHNFTESAVLWAIFRQLHIIGEKLERLNIMPTEADVDAAFATLAQAIVDANNRVIAAIQAVIDNNPSVATDLAKIQSDIAAVNAIAQTPPPPPVPAP